LFNLIHVTGSVRKKYCAPRTNNADVLKGNYHKEGILKEIRENHTKPL